MKIYRSRRIVKIGGSKSYSVKAALARKMIISIKEDSEKIRRGGVLPYRFLGKHC